MTAIDDWLKLAPKPAPLEPGGKWHVFLSYRSSERAWVLSLYDILTQLGYSVFMDQFVLNSGRPWRAHSRTIWRVLHVKRDFIASIAKDYNRTRCRLGNR